MTAAQILRAKLAAPIHYGMADDKGPAGVNCMRIGRTLLDGRAEREVRYYDFPGGRLTQSVFPTGPQSVPQPYGGFYLEAMDANGGWIASTVDLLRFMSAVNGFDTRPDILQPATISTSSTLTALRTVAQETACPMPSIPEFNHSSHRQPLRKRFNAPSRRGEMRISGLRTSEWFRSPSLMGRSSRETTVRHRRHSSLQRRGHTAPCVCRTFRFCS